MNCLGVVLRSSSGTASEIVRKGTPLRGGSNSVLIEDSVGTFWVVKLQNNPQGTLVLANEAFGAMLGSEIGLPFPHWSPIWLTSKFLARRSGLHFGSQFIPHSQDCRMSTAAFEDADRLFCGITLFDVWTMHQDDREFLRSEGMSPVFIDNGHLFPTPNESLGRPRLQAIQRLWQCNPTYLADWVSRIERLSVARMNSMWNSIPMEWRIDRRCPARALFNRALLLSMMCEKRSGKRSQELICHIIAAITAAYVATLS